MTYRRGRYYYRSKREGKRVTTQYLGTGEWADAMALLDDIERQERALEREAMQEEMAREREVDHQLDARGAQVRALTEAVLVANGYHRHKGTWRKRRNGQRGKRD